MTSTPMLTMMDEYVRLGMLNYPSLFPNRLRVLAHSFLVLGNGVEWLKSGVLSLKEYKHDEMRYDDLDDDYYQRRFMREEDDPNDPFFQRMIARNNARNALERAAREERAAKIFELASTKVPESFIFDYDEKKFMEQKMERLRENELYDDGNYGGSYEKAAYMLDLVKSNYLIINNMPKRVEKSFFDGAIEMLDVVIRSIGPDEPHDVLIGTHEFREVLHARHVTYDGGLVPPRQPKIKRTRATA